MALEVKLRDQSLGAVEDRVGADPSPDDVWFAGDDGFAIFECRSAVVCPGQLEDACCALHALDSKSLAKRPAAAQVIDKLSDGDKKGGLLFG